MRGSWHKAGLGVAAALIGCSAPTLTREGQLVFSPGGQHGASVLTANGVEFIDRDELPEPVERSSAFDPWRPPTGFLFPADGVLRALSHPVALEGRGLAVVLRSSDHLVPSWGGEVLLRLDALVPQKAFPEARSSLRPPVNLVIVTDDGGRAGDDVLEDILDDLGQRDRVALVDTARGAHTAVPLVPGENRSLLDGAVERLLDHSEREGRNLGRALDLARRWATSDARLTRRVVVVTDGRGLQSQRVQIARELSALHRARVRVAAIAPLAHSDARTLALFPEHTEAATDRARLAAAGTVLPPPGRTVLENVELDFQSVPAPVHLLEASGGQVLSGLDDDRLFLGDLYVGEARTEVVRLAVPQWVPGEPYALTVRVHYREASSQRQLSSRVDLHFRYSAQVEKLADQRAGDVIAYASALAMVRRLERAFFGESVDRVGGLRGLANWQAHSLGLMARRTGDRSLARQAEVLRALLGALPEESKPAER